MKFGDSKVLIWRKTNKNQAILSDLLQIFHIPSQFESVSTPKWFELFFSPRLKLVWNHYPKKI